MINEKHIDIILLSLVFVSWYVSATLGLYHLGFKPKKITLDLFTKVDTSTIFGFLCHKAFNTNKNELFISTLLAKLFACFALIVSFLSSYGDI